MADQNEIIEDYAESLKELTFPARPIIDNLTDIASENANVADKILLAIKTRIAKSIPDHKLPPLYLLDSICKSVGPPYNILVGDEIFDIFSSVYVLVNDKIRQRLMSMFETWKLTKSKGSRAPLFPKEQMDKIERFLRQARSTTSHATTTHAPPGSMPLLPMRPPIIDHSESNLTNARLIKDIDTLRPIFEQKLANNASDARLQDRFNALNQLRQLLASQTMRVKELQAIQSQLQNIMHLEFGPSNGSNSPYLQNPTPTSTPGPALLPSATSNSVVHQPPTNIANDIFQMLIASGLVKVDQSLVPGSKPHYELRFPKHKSTAPTAAIDKNIESSKNEGHSTVAFTSENALELLLSNAMNGIHNHSDGNSNGGRSQYENLKYNELTKLDVESGNLQKVINTNVPSPSAMALLYSAKPSKCGTCGKRFSDDEDGIKKRRQHLDWHFRINKRLATAVVSTTGKGGVVQSRNWYLDDYAWVNFKDENLLEYSTLQKESQGNANTGEGVPSAAISPVSYVVIPATETNMINKCQICQDQVNATFDDDSGEWRWANCIKVPQEGKGSRKICHVTCFNEANRKRGAEDEMTGAVKREKA